MFCWGDCWRIWDYVKIVIVIIYGWKWGFQISKNNISIWKFNYVSGHENQNWALDVYTQLLNRSLLDIQCWPIVTLVIQNLGAVYWGDKEIWNRWTKWIGDHRWNCDFDAIICDIGVRVKGGPRIKDRDAWFYHHNVVIYIIGFTICHDWTWWIYTRWVKLTYPITQNVCIEPILSDAISFKEIVHSITTQACKGAWNGEKIPHPRFRGNILTTLVIIVKLFQILTR